MCSYRNGLDVVVGVVSLLVVVTEAEADDSGGREGVEEAAADDDAAPPVEEGVMARDTPRGRKYDEGRTKPPASAAVAVPVTEGGSVAAPPLPAEAVEKEAS
jgi:hypothetical protein